MTLHAPGAYHSACKDLHARVLATHGSRWNAIEGSHITSFLCVAHCIEKCMRCVQAFLQEVTDAFFLIFVYPIEVSR